MPMLTTLRMREPVMALPLAAADAVGKGSHLVEHRVHLRHDILPVHENRGTARRAQRDVEDGAILGAVDLFPAEHGPDPGAQSRLIRQPDEEMHRFIGDAVLRVVEEQPRALGGQSLATRRIIGEQRAQVNIVHVPGMGLERLPCGATDKWRCGRPHFFASPESQNAP